MALFKMTDKMIARRADIGKYTNGNAVAAHSKTMRVRGIMKLGESGNAQTTNLYRLIFRKGDAVINKQPAALLGLGCDVNG